MFVGKSPKEFRTFRNFLEFSKTFWKVPNSFELFPINRNQNQNTLLKTLLKRSSTNKSAFFSTKNRYPYQTVLWPPYLQDISLVLASPTSPSLLSYTDNSTCVLVPDQERQEVRLLPLLLRVGNSVKNSTDTIFELEILAQKARAKIRINVQK